MDHVLAASKVSQTPPPGQRDSLGGTAKRRTRSRATAGEHSQKPPPPVPRHPPARPRRRMSDIVSVNLDEHPASGRGRYSTVSVLEPTLRIERSGTVAEAATAAADEQEDVSGAEPVYRIVVTFVLEVAIAAFDSPAAQGRFFDSVSLCCLFRRDEEIDLRPQADAAVTGLQVTRSREKSSSLEAGVEATGVVTTAVAPVLSVQVQRDFKLAYQRSMSSWRMGLSFETYPRPQPKTQAHASLAAKLTAHLASSAQRPARPLRSGGGPEDDSCHGQGHGHGHGHLCSSAPAPALSRQECQQRFFRVLAPHAKDCACPPSLARTGFGCPLAQLDPPNRHGCSPRTRARLRPYNRAAHWFWQTEAALRLWTPETYGSIRCPVTVMRSVPVALVDDCCRQQQLDGDKQPDGAESLRALLHFDFLLDTRLRMLGAGVADLLCSALSLGLAASATKPPELRALTDAGQPLPADRLHFCIACVCPARIRWPRHPTRNLQAEAEAKVAAAAAAVAPRTTPSRTAQTVGKGNSAGRAATMPCRLQTNAEFSAHLRRRWQQRRHMPMVGWRANDEDDDDDDDVDSGTGSDYDSNIDQTPSVLYTQHAYVPRRRAFPYNDIQDNRKREYYSRDTLPRSRSCSRRASSALRLQRSCSVSETRHHTGRAREARCRRRGLSVDGRVNND